MNSNMYLTKIVAASLLGDGCVHIPNDGSINAKYSQNKIIEHYDYVYWLTERLEKITKVHIHEYQPKMENANRAALIHTGVHPFYTKFRKRMYIDGIKVVDPHYLTLLDWEFLSIWYQEDGSMSIRQRERDKRPDIQIQLATDCFSYGDHLLLKDALKEKLNLEWNVRPYTTKNGYRRYRLVLLRSNAEFFCTTIYPFMQDSFKYKCSHDRLLPIAG